MKTATCWAMIGVVALTAHASEPASSQCVQGVINAPVSEVWRVFSTADGFKKLGVAKCEMDFRISGLVRSHYDPAGTIGDDKTIQNEIIAFEPERMISFRIHKPPQGFPFAEETWKQAWTVCTLTDLGDGRTHLRMTGLGYPATEDGAKMRQFFESGNSYVLRGLQSQFDKAVTKPSGAAHATNSLAPISLEKIVELPREAVWRLYTTGDGWKQTMGATANIELRPGGKFEVLFNTKAPIGEQGSEGCTVLSFADPQMISYSWNAPPKFAHARGQRTWVVVHFDELAPTRTRIRLDHLGFAEKASEFPDHRAEWEQVRGYFAAAWPRVLDAIAAKKK